MKIQLATPSTAATLYERCHYVCELVVLPSWHWFRNPVWHALDPRLCLVRNIREWLKKTWRAVAKHPSKICLWVRLDENRAGLQLLLPQVCEMCFVVHYQEKKKWWENVMLTIIHVLSRRTALLTWAASLGWTFLLWPAATFTGTTHL